jgi:hypothetical protein
MVMAMWSSDRTYVAVHSTDAPTDAEWNHWIALLTERAGRDRRILVETRSGPTATQRKALASATKDQDLRFAVLTDSVVVRGIITALAWLGVQHRAFAMDQHRQAAAYLELTSVEFDRVLAELPRLRREAGMEQPRRSTG